MNNFTLKIVASFVLMMFSLYSQGQFLGEAVYRIESGGFYITAKSDGTVTWEVESNDSSQLFAIHKTGTKGVDGDGNEYDFYYISSQVQGAGSLRSDSEAFKGKVVVSEVPINNYLDMWEIRVSSPFLLFISFPREGWSDTTGTNRERIAGAPGAGNNVTLSGGGNTSITLNKMTEITGSTLTVDKNLLTSDNVLMSNPVKDNVSITGLTAEIDQVNVYSLLGAKVLSKEVNNASSMQLNVGALSKGMYIVDFVGQNGNFTKKLIKQ